MSRVFLVRHGETEWNLRGLYQGQADSPLTARGLAQADTVAERFGPLRRQRLVSSDLGRALATAARIAARLGLAIEVDPRLRELHLGQAVGLDRDGIRALPGYELRPDWRFPGGESFHDLEERVLAALADIDAAGADAIVVTHAGPIRAVLRKLHDLSFEQALALRVDPETWLDLDAAALRR
jgi:probable phosphoglycerate mutase